jgi:anaerobic magnesium-protoporphyrin IX monomethyl ester cyclase
MFSLFDSAIVNEGEKPLLSLVEHLSKGQPLNDVPNLIYLDGGKVRVNDILPTEDINLLPTPSFDGLPLDIYLSPEPVLSILASRGCYWGKCAFCSDNLCTAWRYQNRDASKVVNDMQELTRKYGVTRFAFSDEAIAPGAMNKLCDEIINRGMDVRCSTYIRLERQFTPELCRKMYRAGFRLLFLGLESACDRVLTRMNKGIDKETAAVVCRNIHEAGIWNHLLVFLGFPTETRAEAQETIDFLLSNKGIIHSFKMNSFVLDKKSPIAKNPGEYGISYIEDGPDTDFDLTYNYTVPSGLTFDEAVQLNIVSQERIAKEYESQKFFQLDGEDIILYLSHYEGSDPYLKSTAGMNTAGAQAKPLTGNSMPKLRRNVALVKTGFDIIEVIHYLVNNENMVVYPRQMVSIFDPASGNLLPVDAPFVDLLTLCNGKNSVQKIARELTKKYDASQSRIEDDCLAFLKPLYREGYVIS